MQVSLPWQTLNRYLITKRSVVLSVMLLMLVIGSFGQAASSSWPLTADNVAVTTGNITGMNQAGSGVGINSYGVDGVGSDDWATGASPDAGKYYAFAVSPNSGYNLSITDISIDNNTDGISGSALVQYSFDGSFASPVSLGSSFAISTGAPATTNFTGLSITVSNGQTLYIRVFAWDIENSSKIFTARNFTINGSTVSCLPDVSNFSLLTPAAVCAGSPVSITVNSSSLLTDNYTITYDLSGANTASGLSASLSFTAGTPGSGAFTVPAVDFANAGATTVTITSITNSTSCTSPLSSGNSVSAAVTALPVATFSYTGSPYCSNAANPLPIFSGGGVAGAFSSTAGLVFVNTSTGEINLPASTPGTYTVTNTIAAAGGCGVVSATYDITITALPVATFSYAGSPYCLNAANPSPVFSGGGVAGIFSSTTGLIFASTATGEINIAASTPGTYTITNTITAAGGCGIVTATSDITIAANNTVTLSSAAGTNAQTVCINSGITAITYSTTGATGASFTGLPTGVTGNWAANVVTISGTPSVSGTFNYTVTLTGGCGMVTAAGSINVTANNIITLTSVAGTNAQTRCINTAITNITYSTTGATGATFTGLPTGVNGNWAGNVVTISGTPSVSGTFNYTITLIGGCGIVTATGSINVTANNTINRTSAAGTDAQTRCINTAITNITYSTSGATGATLSGLPTGVNGNWAGNVVTISGTPSVSGTFSYTVTLTGGCGTVTTTGSINVTANNTVTLTSAVGTNAQTRCINTAITNINYSTTGATGATFSGLPTGVTGNWAGNVVTISGTPSVSGTFNYTVTLTGGCGTITATGSISVTANNTISLTSAGGTNNQTRCINTAITNITYSTTGATGATFSGLPTGVTGNWAGNVVTISGTPSVNGAFNYTVTLTGGCGTITATGSINVTANNTITLTSAAGTNAQTRCISTAITNITYSTTGATGATFSGLPTGVNGNWAGNVVTISGTPSVSGTFNYTVTLTGGCGTVTATGSIAVTPNNTITLTSAAGTNAQTRCINTAITTITYSTTGATGATFSGLPTGITGSWAANVVTISGTPSVSGTFNYTITLTGGCGTITATGSVTVFNYPAATGITICQNGSGSLTSAAACAAATVTTAGPEPAGTGATGGGAGEAWSNPTRVVANDNSYASVDIDNTSEALNATQFGFAIPANAVINGIQVTIGRYGETANDLQDNSVRLLKAGVATGNNNGATNTDWPGGSSANEAPANYGSTSDLWGTTWTPAQINANNFGVALVVDNDNNNNRTAYVDYIQVTVTYTVPGTLGWFTASSGGTAIGNNSPFNPVGVAGSGLANTNTPGTTTYYAECAAAPGCRTSADFVINPLPTITGNLTVCIGLTSSLTGSGSPAASNAWTSSNTAVATVNASGVVTGVAAGTSTITYTNNNNCSITATVTVSAPAISGTLNVCIGSTRTLTGNGTPAASNPWVSSNTAVATVNASGVVTGVAPGTVNITYTNNNGCFTSSSFTVNALPVVSITGSGAVCAGGPNSTTTLSPTTGGTWASSNNSIATVTNAGVVTGVSAGSATFTFIQTSTGCSNTTAAVTVNARPVVTFTATPGANVCVNTNVTYTTQAGQSNYVWTVPGTAGVNYTIISGGISSTDNTVTLQWLTTGSKTVTVNYSNANGCTAASAASNTTTANARPTPSFTTQPGAAVCASTNVTYTTQTGQSNYVWSVPGTAGVDYTITSGGIGTGNTTVTLQWLTAGNKTVTVNYNNGSGCTGLSAASNTTTVNARPIANAITGPMAVCAGSTIALTSNASGAPALSYTWAASNGNATVTNAGVVTGVSAGTSTITYTVTDGNTCTATSPAYGITINARPTATISIAPGSPICANVNITYTTQPGMSNYIWTIPGVSGIDYTLVSGGTSADNSVTVQWLTTGTKNVTINYTNGNGCTAATAGTSSTLVNARPTPSFTTQPGAFVCASSGVNTTDVIYTTQSGQSNYIWTVPGIAGADYTIVAGGIGTTNNTVTLRWLTTGSKTVTVNYTNGSGCTALTAISNTTTVNALPVVNTSAPAVCVGSTITASPNSAGTWISNNNSIATITNAGVITGVAAGTATFTYTLTATGCARTTTAVTVNALPVVSPITDGAAAICVNDITQFTNPTTGGIWSIINGTGTATVDVNSGLVTGVSSGSVTVVYSYTDGNSCTGSVSVPLSINVLPVVTPIGGGASSVCVNAQTPAFTNATAGGTWSIIDGTGSATVSAGGVVTGLSAGNVTVVYTVGNGTCTNEDAIPLTINPLPVVAPVAGGTTAVCVNSSTPAFTNATTGGVWSVVNGTGTASITSAGVVTGLSAGNVTVVYTYSNGTCTNTATQPLTISALPVIAPIGGGAAAVCINASTPAFTDATGGGTWSIINGSGSASISGTGVVTGLTAGNVTVVYTVGSGLCFDNVTKPLTVNALPTAGAITGVNTVCAGSTINLNANASGTATLTYTWASGDNAFATVSNAGVVTGVAAGTPGITYTVTDGNNCSSTSPVFTVTVNARPVATITSANTTICSGTSTDITGTVTANGAWTVTLSNGAAANGNGNGNFTISVSPAVTTTYTITSLIDANCTAVAGDLTGSTLVTVNQAVGITTQPASVQTTCSGNSVSFTVAATGTGITYQWRKGTTPLSNGGNIAGATSATLTINPVAVGDAATDYNVVISGTAPCLQAVSNDAALIVNEAVAITTQPVSQTVCSGNNVIFTVAATGSGLTYQWRKNGSLLSDLGNISGSNSNTLSITGITSADAANYSVVVSGLAPCAAVTSGNALLTVNNAPGITAQPADVAVCATFPATFTVTATGTGLTYQWYKGTFPGTPVTNNANISGATTASLHFNQANLPNVDDYYVVVSGLAPCTAAVSDYAHLSVDRNITILTQPVSQTVCTGSDVTFNVAASAGGDTLIYQWRKGGINITAAEDTFYTINAATAADAGNYDVVITGLAGCITSFSSVATLTLDATSVGGTVNTSTFVCNGANSGTLTLTGKTGNVVRWESSTDGGNIWNTIANTTTSLTYNNITTETYYRTVVQNGVCAPDNSVPAIISIYPTADVIATPATQTICSGSGITSIGFTGSVPSTTFNWTRNNTGTVTGIAASGTGDISGTLTNTTASPVTVTFTITPTANGCTGTISTVTVVVDPSPVAAATPASQTVCSGDAITAIALTSTTGGTTFTWTRNNIVAVSGIAASGSGDITGSLINNTNAPVTVTFTITPSANGCDGTPVTATVLVNPTPNAVALPANQTACSDQSITTISLTGNVGSTTFNWTRDNTATVTGIAVSGSGNISGILSNPTNAPVTVTFTITPTANGCNGTPVTATIVVSPAPVAVAAPSAQSVCSGQPVTTIALSSPMGGTTYSWTRDNLVAISGIAASGSGDINGSLTNNTNAPVTVTFTITPTTTGCDGTPITATVTVNPIPGATALPSSQTSCSGAAITTIVLNSAVASTTYTWTRDNNATVTGIAASGSGDISGILSNTTTSPVTVTFTITPTADGCPGTPITSTVTVNPSANAIATPSSQSICSGNSITAIVLTSSFGATTFNWTRDNTATVTGIAANGSGNISGSLTNTTASPVTVTFTIVPTSGGCPGTSTLATVVVNPGPNAAATNQIQQICSGSAISTIAVSSTTPGASLNWTRNNTGTVTGITANGTGDISGSLTNTTNANITVTFSVTASIGGCVGAPVNATVLVKPLPTVNATNNSQTICSGNITAITVTNPNTVAGTSLTWTRDNTASLTGIAASGTGNISGALNNATTAQQTSIFTITAAASGCSSVTTATIVVNPRPVMTSANTAIACNNSTVNIPLTSNISATYTWVAANNGNVTGESTTTQTTSTINNTLVNTSAVAYLTPKQNVVYTVTPTAVAGLGGCAGTAQTVTVTVLPNYNISFYEYPTDDNVFTICDGEGVGGGGQNDMDLIEGQYAGSALLWQYSIGSNSGPWTATPGPHGNTGIHDTLPDPPSIFSPMGDYYFRLLVDGCPSDIIRMTKTSTLVVNAGGPNNTVCQVGSPSAITLSGASITGTASTTIGGYWSITGANPSNGGNNGTLSSTNFLTPAQIPNATYTPPANYAGVITLTLTSNDPDGNGPCVPITKTRTITVTQAPIISNPLTASVCSGSSTNINLTSVIPSTYAWTIGTITGGITGASAGSGNLISQVLTNPGTTAGTVQYVVTPTPVSPASCAAVTTVITVTVNALPSVSVVSSPSSVCFGNSATLTATNSGGTLMQTYSGYSGSLNAMITDDSRAAYPYSTITLAGSNGAALNNTDVIQVKFSINHPYVSDLDIFLVDPSGTRAMHLSTDNGGTGDNYTNTILRTDAANVIGSGGNNTAPFTGTYRPEGTITTAPDRTGATGGNNYNAVIPANALNGAPIDGAWSLRVFDDAANDYGFLVEWSLDITKTAGNYTSVFNGPATIGAVSYSGTSNTTATASVTPPAGVNAYTVTTTDIAGCSRTSAPVNVTVNPAPTLTAASQVAAVCAGSSAQISLAGLFPNSTSTITYKINNGSTQTLTGLVADGSGNAVFSTPVLTFANNGQNLTVTSVTTTSTTPNCSQILTQNAVLMVNPTPTLTGASQLAAVCPGTSATINLSGLVASSIITVSYTINGGSTETATNVAVTAGGTATFSTVALTQGNNGQTLQITGVTITSATPNCAQSFTRNVTLNVNPTPNLNTNLTPPAICSGSTFTYNPNSGTPGSSFSWTRPTVPGISQPGASGTGTISQVLTNTTSSVININCTVTTSANGCNNAGETVVITVNPSPNVTAASLSATVCAGSGGVINLTGLIPGSTSTVNYSINGAAQTPVTGVVANGSGAASFTTRNLTAADNSQILRVTGMIVTSSTPNCARTISGVLTILNVNSIPTLTTAAQSAPVCISTGAVINLTGLVANSTNNTINYTINGVAQTPVTGVNADAGGAASFTTAVLTAANNGQTLTVTSIQNGPCTQGFTQNVLLSVGATNTWLGVNTNWFDVQNWCAGIPTSTTDVVIPGSLANYPLLNTGTGSARNINIQNTASVTVSGAKLQIAGAITNTGTFNATNGTIELNGTAGAQSISGSIFVQRTLGGLIISNTSGVNVSAAANDTLNIADSLAFGNVSNTVLNTGDNVTLLSRAVKTARVADITNGGANTGNSFAGKVIVERFVPERRSWRLLTVPLQQAGSQTFNAAWQEGVVNPDIVYANHLDPHPGYGMLITGPTAATGFDPSPRNNHSVYQFNPSTLTWSGIPNTLSAKVTDSAGYLVFVRGDRSTEIYLNTAAPVSNTILRASGSLKTNTQTTVVPAGIGAYSVVGNPYASSIDLRKISTSGGVSGVNYVVWDPALTGTNGVGAYQYLTRTGGPGTDYIVFPGNSAAGGGSYGAAFSVNNTLQSGQAFLAQNAGAGTISINENAKIVPTTSAVFRPVAPAVNSLPFGYISTLLLYENGNADSLQLVDGALMMYREDYSNDIDLEDAKKMSNISSENFGVSSNNNWMQIEKRQHIQAEDTIFYKVKAYRIRDYQLKIEAAHIDEPGLTAYLEDNYLQTSTPVSLNGTTVYRFKVTADTGAWRPDRLRIVFRKNVVLPVTFSSVKANKHNDNIIVDWKTEHELNIAKYEVERSHDGIKFEKAFTEMNVKNNDRGAAYSWVDTKPFAGFNFYRIRSVEMNGAVKYSEVVKVMFEKTAQSITLYPNPLVDGTFNLYFTNEQSGDYSLRLLNSAGQLIEAGKIRHTDTSVKEVFKPKQQLLHGHYILEITKPGGAKQTISAMY